MDIKRISITVLSGVFIEFLNKVAPLIIIFVIQRRIGVNSFGYAMFGISMVELFLPLVVFGYSHSGSVRLAELRHNPAEAGKFISDIVMLRLIHATLVCLIFTGCTLALPGYHKYQLLAFCLSFSFFAASCEVMWVFMAIQNMAVFNLCIGVGRLLGLVLILVFVQNKDHGLRYAFLSLLSNAAINIITFFLISKSFPLCRPSLRRMKSIFSHSVPFALILGLTGFLDRADMLLVERSGGPEAAGLYAGPARIAHSLTQISNAIILAFFSEMMILRDPATIRKHLLLGTLILISWCAPVISGGFFVAEELLDFLFGSEYREARWLFIILLFNMMTGSLILAFGMQILILHKRTGFLTFSLAAGALVILIPLLPGKILWSSESIALIVVAGKCLSLSLISYKVRDILKYFPWGAIGSGLLPSVMMSLALWIFRPQNFVLTILGGAVICVLSAMLIHRNRFGEIAKIWKK